MSQRIPYLLDQYLNNTATAEEKQELAELLDNNKEVATDELLNFVDRYATPEWKASLIDEQVQQVLEVDKVETITAPGKVDEGFKLRRLMVRIAVAASVLLVISLGLYFLLFNKKKEMIEATVVQDVKAPASNRAMITLANGDIIYLDSAGNGYLAKENNTEIIKSANGELIYSGAATELQYNTLNNPRGSKVQPLTLSDGTKLWLNAGSSVTYPVAFIGNERKVTITGEAYFEVAHDVSKPFIVSKGSTSVTVLGTHFNVNAYDDEDAIRVTLLEGSVKVNDALIKPGEQAATNASGAVYIVSDVNTEEVMAWKNGRFYFDGADIKTIMRQVAVWYNVEVKYDATINDTFVAKIARDVPVSELLKILSLTNLVHFDIANGIVTVKK